MIHKSYFLSFKILFIITCLSTNSMHSKDFDTLKENVLYGKCLETLGFVCLFPVTMPFVVYMITKEAGGRGYISKEKENDRSKAAISGMVAQILMFKHGDTTNQLIIHGPVYTVANLSTRYVAEKASETEIGKNVLDRTYAKD